VQPAKAFAELMRRHPSVQAGDFEVGEAYRTMNPDELQAWEQSKGFLDPVNTKKYFPGPTIVHGLRGKLIQPFKVEGMKGKPHAVVMLDAGMGGQFPHFFGLMNRPKFTWNPEGAVGFISDYANKGADIDQKANFLNAFSRVDGRLPAVAFGRHGIPSQDYGRMKPFFHRSVHQLVRQSVLDEAKAWSDTKRPEVWANLTQHLAKEDPQSALQLADALTKGKKIVTVSGSSRGDLVAFRAAELQNTLRQHGLTDHIQVVAALGNAKGHQLDKSEALLNDYPEVVRVGHTNRYPGVAMSDLIHAADGHWNGLGASSFAESLLSPTHTFYVTRYKTSDGVFHKQIAAMRQKGLDTRYLTDAAYEPDRWNEGAIEMLHRDMHGKGIGADVANGTEELLPFLHRLAAGDVPRYAGRASKMLKDTEYARKSLADAIINKATFLRASAENSRNIRLVGAAGLLGAGGIAAANAYRNRTPEPSRLQQATQRLADLWNRHRR
jgi:hypothetical protein